MNLLDKKNTIGEVVAVMPEATKIFRDFNIDYCCGGYRNLKEVIKEQGIDENTIYERISQAYEERINRSKKVKVSFQKMSPPVLSAYIEDTHHAYLRKALPEISELLSTILRIHGGKHKELFSVYRIFGQLKADLEQHLLKEETMLFPELGESGEGVEETRQLSAEIVAEHEAAGELLRELSGLTHGYQAPLDGCGTYKKTYAMLEELEIDLHEHIHLENNILLKDYIKR